MGLNTNIFTDLSGKIKLLSIIAGAIAVGLAVDHYYKSVTEEEAFFGSIITCLILSVILAVASIAGLMDNANAKKIDKVYHLLAAILLIITASFYIVSVDKNKNSCFGSSSGCRGWYAQRASAGAFGLLQGVICGYIGWLLV